MSRNIAERIIKLSAANIISEWMNEKKYYYMWIMHMCS